MLRETKEENKACSIYPLLPPLSLFLLKAERYSHTVKRHALHSGALTASASLASNAALSRAQARSSSPLTFSLGQLPVAVDNADHLRGDKARPEHACNRRRH